MASLFGAGQGKSRSSSGMDAKGMKFLDRAIIDTGAVKGLNDDLVAQMSEALRTGGIGAALPIVQQSISGASQAQSDAMRGTEAGLSSSGLSRTPYGQSILAGQRFSGAQAIGRIPTDYASQFIAQAPQFGGSLMQTILGSLQKTKSKSGAYAT